MTISNQARRGLFWVRDDPDHKMEGQVEPNSRGGLVLTTYDYPETDSLSLDEKTNFQGLLSGEHITLLRCVRTKHQEHMDVYLPDRSEDTWHPTIAFRGDEYHGEVPNRITSAEVRIESTEDWVSGFENLEFAHDEHQSSITWTNDTAEQKGIWLLGEVSIRRNNYSSWENARHANLRHSVFTTTSFHLRFDPPQDWGTVSRTVTNLQALMSSAMGEAVNIEWERVVAQTDDGDAHLLAFGDRILHKSDRPMQRNQLFTMDELGGVQGIADWLTKLHEQQLMTHALLADVYRQPTFVTDRTSHLLSVCEAYQRVRTHNRRGNFQLRSDILNPMLDTAGTPFEEWIGDRDAWTKQVRQIRNQHGVAHMQGYPSPDDDAGIQIHQVNEQLHTLLVLNILTGCGLPEKVLRSVIQRTRSEWRTIL